MTIKTETRTVEITLKLWSEPDGAYGPDVFGELVADFSAAHGGSATDAEVDALIDQWLYEVREANSGSNGDILEALDDDDINSGCEWVLSVNECWCSDGIRRRAAQ